LVPYLESRAQIFKFLLDFDITKTRALFIRCTGQPLVRLAETIYDWGEQPLLIDIGEEEPLSIDIASLRAGENDRATFAARVGNSVPDLMKILRQIHDLFPKWLILIVDQGEEILTETRSPDANGQRSRELFFEFITTFNEASLNLKLVIALRSEYWADFQATMRQHGYDESQMPWYNLKELSDDDLIEAIEIPTSRKIREPYLQGRCQPAMHTTSSSRHNWPSRLSATCRKSGTSRVVFYRYSRSPAAGCTDWPKNAMRTKSIG
jgi:hypothetical protein